MEPFFDCYEPMTLMAGGRPVFVTMKPVRMLAGWGVGRQKGSKECVVLARGRWERREEGKEAGFFTMGRGIQSPRRKRVGTDDSEGGPNPWS